MTTQKKKPQLDVQGVPAQEEVSQAQAAEQAGLDPDEQVNYPDQPGHEDAAAGLREDDPRDPSDNPRTR